MQCGLVSLATAKSHRKRLEFDSVSILYYIVYSVRATPVWISAPASTKICGGKGGSKTKLRS